MKKIFAALAALLMMVAVAPAAIAAPDDSGLAELKKAGLSNDEALKALIEIMQGEIQNDSDSPLDGIWISDEHNAVVFSMVLDAEGVQGVKQYPSMFKPLLRNELFGDKDMKDFARLVAETGRSLDLFMHTPDEKESAVISYSAEEILNLK